jgi:hypothetical protein
MPKITDPDIVQRIAEVEGPNWIRDMVDGTTEGDMFSVAAALAMFNKGRWINAIIYGLGGWDRYFVMEDGEVAYSASHGRTNLPKAEAAGFRIHR